MPETAVDLRMRVEGEEARDMSHETLAATRLTERTAVAGVMPSPLAARAPGDAMEALAGTPAPT